MSADWFKQSLQAKNDPRLRVIKAKLGSAGLGAWYELLQELGNQPGYRYPLKLSAGLAGQVSDSGKELAEFLDLATEVGLLEKDETHFWSPDLIESLDGYEGKREAERLRKKAERAKKKAEEEARKSTELLGSSTTVPDLSVGHPQDVPKKEEGRPQDASLSLSKAVGISSSEGGPGETSQAPTPKPSLVVISYPIPMALDTPRVRAGLAGWAAKLRKQNRTYDDIQHEFLCNRFLTQGPDHFANSLEYTCSKSRAVNVIDAPEGYGKTPQDGPVGGPNLAGRNVKVSQNVVNAQLSRQVVEAFEQAEKNR